MGGAGVSTPERVGLVHRPVPTLLATTLSITIGALPIFLTGAMAVFIRPELGFGETALGALATLYYLATALTTIPASRLAERLGGPRAMSVAAMLSMLASIGIALFANSWLSLAALLVVAGVGNGIAFPSTNLAFARGFPLRRQGVAFAIKQSAGPYATLLSGAAVPLLGLTVGWRWAFLAAGLAAIPIIAGWRVQQGGGKLARGKRSDVPGRPLWILALAAFFAVNAGASLGAFYVESAVASGFGPALAGTFLSIGSGLGIAVRVVWGWIGDRHPALHFTMLTAMLAVGAIAFASMGRAGSTAGLLAVTILVFATGWAWPSLLNFAVVQRLPQAPGIASGILGTGQYGGGILGPITFGLVAERVSYRAAWSTAGVMVGLAAVCVFIGGKSLERAVGRSG